MPPTCCATPRCCGWKTSTPICCRRAKRSTPHAPRWPTTTPTATCRSSATTACARPPRRLVERTGGYASGSIDWRRQCFISAGGLSGVLNALLALIEPGDEVVLTSPTYVGLINRVRLAGGVPRFVRLLPAPAGWRLDASTLARAVTPRTRAFLMMSPSMPSGAVLDRDEWAGGVRGLRGRRRLDDLRQRDGAPVVRRRAALASGAVRRHGRAHGHRRRGIEGVPHDRLARRLGGVPAAGRRGDRPRRDLQRGVPGGHRAAGGGRGDRSARRRHRALRGHLAAAPRRTGAIVVAGLSASSPRQAAGRC